MASDGGGEEDFVTYGTPLEPLEEGRVRLEVHRNRDSSGGFTGTGARGCAFTRGGGMPCSSWKRFRNQVELPVWVLVVSGNREEKQEKLGGV